MKPHPSPLLNPPMDAHSKKPSLCATATIPSMSMSSELGKLASKARTKLAEDTVSPISTTWAKRSPHNKQLEAVMGQ